jgi:hypothetical protein
MVVVCTECDEVRRELMIVVKLNHLMDSTNEQEVMNWLNIFCGVLQLPITCKHKENLRSCQRQKLVQFADALPSHDYLGRQAKVRALSLVHSTLHVWSMNEG